MAGGVEEDREETRAVVRLAALAVGVVAVEARVSGD